MRYANNEDSNVIFKKAVAYVLAYWFVIQLAIVAHAYFFPTITQLFKNASQPIYIFIGIVFGMWHTFFDEKIASSLFKFNNKTARPFNVAIKAFIDSSLKQKALIVSIFIYALIFGSTFCAMTALFLKQYTYEVFAWGFYMIFMFSLIFYLYKVFCCWTYSFSIIAPIKNNSKE